MNTAPGLTVSLPFRISPKFPNCQPGADFSLGFRDSPFSGHLSKHRRADTEGLLYGSDRCLPASGGLYTELGPCSQPLSSERPEVQGSSGHLINRLMLSSSPEVSECLMTQCGWARNLGKWPWMIDSHQPARKRPPGTPEEESSQAIAIPAGGGQVCVKGPIGVRPIRIQR